jgi:diguanylate cyclase (GGDEF)-like protein/PAS domain S-box-containing protein
VTVSPVTTERRHTATETRGPSRLVPGLTPVAAIEATTTRRPVAPWLYVGSNVPLVVLIYCLPRYHVYLWGLLGLGSAVAIVVGIVRNQPTHRAAWVLVAFGVTVFAFGDITYDVLTEFMHESNPYPSVADVFYLATYVFLASGLLLMVRSRRRRDGDTGAALDALIVTAGLGALSWMYLIQPYVHAADMALLSKLTSIAYPLGDIVLLCVIVRLVFGGGSRGTSVRFLALGTLGVLGADCIYGWIQLHGSWKVGGPTDLGWVLFYVCWGAAALHPAMRDLTTEQPSRPRQLSPVTLILLSGCAMVAPVALACRDVAGVPADGGILAIVSVVVFVLVILRLIGLARVQAVVARREQALRSFSEYLVAATDRLDVWKAGMDAVLGIGAEGVIGCIVIVTTSRGDEVIAATWPECIGERVKVAKLSARSDRCAVRLPNADTLAGTPGATIWTQLKSPERGVSWERILLAHDASLSLDLRAILDGIAAQLFLALERVEMARVVNEARNERRFQAMVKYSSDLITLVGTDLHIVFQSPAVGKILGRLHQEFLGRSLVDVIHPDDVAVTQTQLAKVLAGGLGSTSTFEFRMAHTDGQWRIFSVVLTNLFDEPDVGAIVLNSRDVTDRHALEQELNHQAFHDTLTGLANRSLFIDRLSHALDRASREQSPVAVLFLDLDDFKAVNDSFGHPAGDQLLVEVAGRIRSATRPGDTVARFGGDEFAVLVESGLMPEAAKTVAQRITEALVPTFRVLTNDVTMRASIGITIAERPHETPDDLLRDADLAMYVAKGNGKGRFEMYRPKMHEDAVRLLETEVGIREGLEQRQFEVFYQPIVNTHTGQLVAAEALVRWNHPTRGLLAPSEFISVAEDTGLIIPLGAQVLADAIRQTQDWRRGAMVDEEFHVSVNLSAHQLQEVDLVDCVARALTSSGLPPKALVLEVTESALIENLDVTVPRLVALRALGVRLAIDDFGTGYSSLSYLADLPINFVKIDKSFIDRIALGAEGSAVVRGVIDLSRAMGFTCIAEGVEQEVQRRILDDLGCDYIQGFLFARPANRIDVTRDFKRLQVDQSVVLIGRR